MTIGFIFWLIFLLSLLFGAYVHRGAINTPLVWAPNFLLWVLIFCLGLQVFGWPIRG